MFINIKFSVSAAHQFFHARFQTSGPLRMRAPSVATITSCPAHVPPPYSLSGKKEKLKHELSVTISQFRIKFVTKCRTQDLHKIPSL